MVQKIRLSGPDDGSRMSVNVTADREQHIQIARDLAVTLQRRERLRVGSIVGARASIARKLGIGSGSFERIVRGRVKRVDAWIRDRLQALLIRELEAEIMRLTHELAAARQCGAHLASRQVSEVEAHLAAAKAALGVSASVSAEVPGEGD